MSAKMTDNQRGAGNGGAASQLFIGRPRPAVPDRVR